MLRQLTFLTSLLLLLTVTHSHNWMIQPAPYNRKYKRTQNCQGIYCRTACQQKLRDSYNSRERPDRTYQRGQSAIIKYTRNNHRGGFLRIALVPVDKMWDRDWHTRMTIMHGCWESGQYTCKTGDCGTDKSRLAYRRLIKIPDVFPDGDYVLGYVWYGGIHFTREKGFFGDFYSCSHVRIRGGAPLSNRNYVPYFEPGTGEYIQEGLCQTSADAVGQCGNKGCSARNTFWAIPRDFQNGRTPNGITWRDVAEGFDTPVNTDDASDLPTSVTGKSSGPPQSQSRASKPETHTPRSKPGRRVNIRGRPALCRGKDCCPAICGNCGGVGCHKRPGGGPSCCRGAIRRSGRRCAKDAPPCRM